MKLIGMFLIVTPIAIVQLIAYGLLTTTLVKAMITNWKTRFYAGFWECVVLFVALQMIEIGAILMIIGAHI